MTDAVGKPFMPHFHIRDRIAGFLAAAVALSISELLTGVSGVSSLVVAIGDFVVDRSPGVVTKTVINALGTKDKPALILLIIVSVLSIGTLLGPASRRHFSVAIFSFLLTGIVGVIAGIRMSQDDAPILVLTVVTSVAAGVITLRVLLRSAAGKDSYGPIEMPSEGSRGSRREFFRIAAAIGVVAAGSALVSRTLNKPRVNVEAARSAAILPTVSRTSAVSYKSEFTVRGLSPLITPNSQFFRIDTALLLPRVDIETWRLRIGGMVDEPLELTFAELLDMPVQEEPVTLACVSNRVGEDLIGNAVWLGVPLRDLLDIVGVQRGSTQIVARSIDGFTAGFPTVVAMDGRPSMVAFGMNGEPLPVEHGFPARIIVPGLYGYVSATKWLSEIELTTMEAYDAYWIRRGWSKEAPIKTQSRIDVPRSGQSVTPGKVTIAGVAWSGDRDINSVEVQLLRHGENDAEWKNAKMSQRLSESSWRQWVLDWVAIPGEYRIAVRATDGNGDTQTGVRSEPFPNGATGYHAITLKVRDQ